MNAEALPSYLASLNPEQLAAVRHEGHPLLILAGAGSGKTRVITTKIAWLVRERGIDPEAILAVTFTNKAAKEMRERAAAIEPACERSMIRTFHSFGAWFLRRNARAAAEGAVPGLDPDFTIYDEDDQTTLLHAALPALARNECSSYVRAISRAKDYGLEPDSPELDRVAVDPQFRRIYALYEERLRATGNLDFGDLIRLPARLLREDEAIRRRTRQRFRVILVDEYQDSNVAQFELLSLLAGRAGPGPEDIPPAYLSVVGDDDQSIYRFRGAEVRNILDFPSIFPGTEMVRLERNYRSFQAILDVAGSVVAHNAGRLGKELRAERLGGAKPRLALLDDHDAEAAYCARVCEERRRKGGRWSDAAILYRTNAQSLAFERLFPRLGIPYRIVGSLRFYEREEVKDILAYLALLSNPRDEVAFRRIANKPARGVGDTSLEAILEEAGPGGDLLEASYRGADSLRGKAKTGIKSFASLCRELRDSLTLGPEAGRAAPKRLSELVERLARDSGLLDYHREQDDVAGTQKVSNLEELANAASLYELSRAGLAEFLETVELDRSLAAEETDTDAVTLITMHNTKGLEFPLVLVTGLEQGLFPREDEEGEELEEQRRLFYVAITRAKDELHLTACRYRLLRGRIFETLPSRFLSEIPSGSIDFVPGGAWGRGAARNPASGTSPSSGAGFGASRNADYSRRSPADPSSDRRGAAASGEKSGPTWRAGMAVYHDDYGSGVIVQVKPTPNSGPLVVVRFETGKQAQFFPAYTTKLERLR